MIDTCKKWIMLLMSVALGGAMVSAFSAGGVSASGFRPAAKSTLRIWYTTDDPVESKWATGLVPLFEKSHHNINVQMKVYDLDDGNDAVQDALASGQAPDLTYVTPRAPAIPIYVMHDELTNLTSYAKKDGWSNLLRPGLLKFWNAPFGVWLAKHKGLKANSKKVQIYGAPDAMSAVGLMYNTKLLKRLHLSVPRTLGQLKSDAVKAKKAGIVPFGLGNQDQWLGDDWYLTLANAMLPASFLQRVLADSPSFTFNRTPFKTAGQLLYGWRSKGYFNHDYAGLDAQGGVDAFFRGHNTLFQLISSSEDAQVIKDKAETHVPAAIEAFPASIKGHVGVMPYSGYEGWVVPKASHNVSGAVAWINFMLHSTATGYTMKHGVLPTTRVSAGHAPTALQNEFLGAFAKARRGIYVDAAPVPNLTATMEANVADLLAHSETAATVQKAMEEVYKSYGKTSNHASDIDGEY